MNGEPAGEISKRQVMIDYSARDDEYAEYASRPRHKLPGVGRIFLGLFVTYVGAVIMLIPSAIFILGGGDWESYLEQARWGFVVFTLLSLLVMYLGVRMIIKRILLRRSARKKLISDDHGGPAAG